MAGQDEIVVTADMYEATEIVVTQAEIDRWFDLVFGRMPPRTEDQ